MSSPDQLTEEPLPPSVTILPSPYANGAVYLLGTVHVSSVSADEVARIIQLKKPQIVMVELCASRAAVMTMKDRAPRRAPSDSSASSSAAAAASFSASSASSSSSSSVSASASSPSKSPGLIRTAIESFQKGEGLRGVFTRQLGEKMMEIGDKIDVMPGAEFQRAYQEAVKIRAKVVLGDRPVEITLKRTWAALSVFEKLKFLWMVVTSLDADELTKETIESLKNPEVLEEMTQELVRKIPSAITPLVYERDMFLSSSLKQCAREAPVVVGVVGLGHVPGIVNYWDKEVNKEALLRMPVPNRARRLALLTVGLALVPVTTYLVFKLAKHFWSRQR